RPAPRPAEERPALLADERPPTPGRRRLAPTLVTAFTLALAPAAAGLGLLLFPAADDGRPPEKPLIQVVPRPAVAGTGTATPIAPLPPAGE
ncbi:hypothetical protein, partial [Pseudonocardia lacus]|uniref:hypothetical protein n=1 Tax=Pseudonocardia lacus TaxID=2835865 RepID=UPI001BDDB3B2